MTFSIFVDETTVCQPNLKITMKLVTLACYYHSKNRTSESYQLFPF